MSRTAKEGKRFRVKLVATSGVKAAVQSRHTWGSTEKILRRNRKTWTRLSNKRRPRVTMFFMCGLESTRTRCPLLQGSIESPVSLSFLRTRLAS